MLLWLQSTGVSRGEHLVQAANCESFCEVLSISPVCIYVLFLCHSIRDAALDSYIIFHIDLTHLLIINDFPFAGDALYRFYRDEVTTKVKGRLNYQQFALQLE